VEEKMSRVQIYRTMARYNRWMNEKLYSVCAEIPDADRKADLGAFFKSIHGILNHLLLTDCAWMGRFTGVPFAASSLDQELFSGFDELRQERAVTDAAIEAWVAGLTEEALSGTLRFTTFTNPEVREAPLWHAVTHIFNHQTHHRGQLTTLMSQLGYDSGVTDLMWLPPAE
jgi:uncharacterized damage-inducible protein DinB